MAGRTRFLFTEADSLDLRGFGAGQDQQFLHVVGTALSQGQVVLAATAFVGIAFHTHFGIFILAQIGAFGLYDGSIIWLYRIHIEREKYATIFRDRNICTRGCRSRRISFSCDGSDSGLGWFHCSGCRQELPRLPEQQQVD